MMVYYNLASRIGIYFFFILLLPIYSNAETVTLDMVIPVDGVAHEADGGFTLPIAIMGTALSTDQDLTNLLDNNPSTFYQPAAGSNGNAIGSDVLLDFEFPPDS